MPKPKKDEYSTNRLLIDLHDQQDISLKEVFGNLNVPMSMQELNKKMWEFVKSQQLVTEHKDDENETKPQKKIKMHGGS